MQLVQMACTMQCTPCHARLPRRRPRSIAGAFTLGLRSQHQNANACAPDMHAHIFCFMRPAVFGICFAISGSTASRLRLQAGAAWSRARVAGVRFQAANMCTHAAGWPPAETPKPSSAHLSVSKTRSSALRRLRSF